MAMEFRYGLIEVIYSLRMESEPIASRLDFHEWDTGFAAWS